MAKKLNPKQIAFCEEYIIDLNATQAAIRAGYSAKTAQAQSSRLLSNVMVNEYITELKLNRSERTAIDADYVLSRLVEIDKLDVLDILEDNGELKAISNWPKSWRTSILGIEINELFEGRGEDRECIGFAKKIKFPDKVKNLDMLGKHVSVRAWEKEIELSTTVHNIMPVPTAASAEEWEQASIATHEKNFSGNDSE